MATIFSLPIELLLAVSTDLTPASIISLRMTCRSLRDRLEPLIPNGYRVTMNDLLEIETWPEYHPALMRPLAAQYPDSNDYFACSNCLTLKSADAFADNMMKGRRGKFANESTTNKSSRLCITCGIERGVYAPGTKLYHGGAKRIYGFVCETCSGFEEFQNGGSEGTICSGCS
ncbi:hypothetical protein TWF481_007803 [Arthrobotrys musiformis]|uniref:F-box domain-containing protein n=1 Tax=Arthrobotrys musiformis TaxID=47236 RepID=A0AAV9W687_9PEZI